MNMSTFCKSIPINLKITVYMTVYLEIWAFN